MAMIGEWCAGLTTAETVARLEAAGVPVSPYRDLSAALDDPQLAHREMLTRVVDAAGPLTVPDSPFLFSATTAAVRPAVPGLGEHGPAVLRDELGFGEEACRELRESGILGAH
jgi:formyl-CoA transferase